MITHLRYLIPWYWLRLTEFLWLYLTLAGHECLAQRHRIEQVPQTPRPDPVLLAERRAALSGDSIAEARARVKAHFAGKQRDKRVLAGKLPVLDFSVTQGREITIEVDTRTPGSETVISRTG